MVAVSYYCPRCGAVAELDRDPYLADKSVTPFPLEGWTYASPDDDFESDDWDGVRLDCGTAHDGLLWARPPTEDERRSDEEPGCGEAFYLNFVRFEDGREVEGEAESERVRLSETLGPQNPGGPGGPSGPGFSR
ncbi:hypothetical protein [Halobacterium jilantaiense]|uniref:DUF7969 domain-containing protein n=1 Tax=Halobacterium jilantaiense TaxID=355548 RepID=A0A1I0QQ51_9EURY|nr:hypothetical protein [Halobacterium jilantaiense]SEW29540.1 hypothetical protein SAMN04487945_2837 [Halobacterium jilantaiense]